MIATFKPGKLKYRFPTAVALTALTSVALTQPVYRSDIGAPATPEQNAAADRAASSANPAAQDGTLISVLIKEVSKNIGKKTSHPR